MRLSEKNVTRFQELFKRLHGIELNEDETSEQAENILQILKFTYKPIPKEAGVGVDGATPVEQ